MLVIVLVFVLLFLFDDVFMRVIRLVPACIPADGGANRRARGGTGDRARVAADLTPNHGAGGTADRSTDGLIAASVEIGTSRYRQ